MCELLERKRKREMNEKADYMQVTSSFLHSANTDWASHGSRRCDVLHADREGIGP
jgi:hypothetical protein